MISIADIEDGLISEIKAALTGEGTVDTCVGDPIAYLVEAQAGQMPCILIQYAGSTPFADLYHGVIDFNIYFCHDKADTKVNQRKLLGFMQDVFTRLQGNMLGYKIGQAMWYRSQANHSYDTDFIIYSQKWDIGVIN